MTILATGTIGSQIFAHLAGKGATTRTGWRPSFDGSPGRRDRVAGRPWGRCISVKRPGNGIAPDSEASVFKPPHRYRDRATDRQAVMRPRAWLVAG